MTVPPQECATSTVGPSCSASARLVASTDSASDDSGFCTAVTLRPAAWRIGITSDQLEPSAQAPCTSTTFFAFTVCGVCACARLSGAASRLAATKRLRQSDIGRSPSCFVFDIQRTVAGAAALRLVTYL